MDPLDRIEGKLDRVVTTLADQAVTLARNTVSLEEHVKRTNLLQAAHEALDARLEPLTAAHQRWVGAGKALAIVGGLCAALGSLAAVGEALIHVLGHLR